MLILKIYILGFILSVLHLAFLTHSRTNNTVNYIFCILLVLMEKQTYKHTLKSWLYFIN